MELPLMAHVYDVCLLLDPHMRGVLVPCPMLTTSELAPDGRDATTSAGRQVPSQNSRSDEPISGQAHAAQAYPVQL